MTWPADPSVESLQGILARTRRELQATVECLRNLADAIEWDADTKPMLDKGALFGCWYRVQRLLDAADKGGTMTDTTQQKQDGLSRAFERTRLALQEANGLDLSRPLTDLERESWTRELALGAFVSIGQLFDSAAGLCLDRESLVRWRRRRALDALVQAIQLAQLHGVTEALLLKELDPTGSPDVCTDCGGTGRVAKKSRYLGGATEEQACPRCQ